MTCTNSNECTRLSDKIISVRQQVRDFICIMVVFVFVGSLDVSPSVLSVSVILISFVNIGFGGSLFEPIIDDIFAESVNHQSSDVVAI